MRCGHIGGWMFASLSKSIAECPFWLSVSQCIPLGTPIRYTDGSHQQFNHPGGPMRFTSTSSFVSFALVMLVVTSSPAYAQKLITQAKVNAGNVTPGDTPGFPLTISQKGAYKLTGNLTVPNQDTTAIVITADNV